MRAWLYFLLHLCLLALLISASKRARRTSSKRVRVSTPTRLILTLDYSHGARAESETIKEAFGLDWLTVVVTEPLDMDADDNNSSSATSSTSTSRSNGYESYEDSSDQSSANESELDNNGLDHVPLDTDALKSRLLCAARGKWTQSGQLDVMEGYFRSVFFDSAPMTFSEIVRKTFSIFGAISYTVSDGGSHEGTVIPPCLCIAVFECLPYASPARLLGELRLIKRDLIDDDFGRPLAKRSNVTSEGSEVDWQANPPFVQLLPQELILNVVFWLLVDGRSSDIVALALACRRLHRMGLLNEAVRLAPTWQLLPALVSRYGATHNESNGLPQDGTFLSNLLFPTHQPFRSINEENRLKMAFDWVFGNAAVSATHAALPKHLFKALSIGKYSDANLAIIADRSGLAATDGGIIQISPLRLTIAALDDLLRAARIGARRQQVYLPTAMGQFAYNLLRRLLSSPSTYALLTSMMKGSPALLDYTDRLANIVHQMAINGEVMNNIVGWMPEGKGARKEWREFLLQVGDQALNGLPILVE